MGRWTGRSGSGVCLLGCLLLVPPLVQAGGDEQDAGGWRAVVGVGGAVLPRYSGADSYRARPLPFVDVRWGDRVFFNPFRGLGWNAVQRDGFEAGPLVRYLGGRRGSGALSDARSVRGGVAAGVFVTQRIGRLRIDAEATAPFTGDVDGVRAVLGASLDGLLTPRLSYSIGPSLVWSSRRFSDSIYGLSERDAAATGLEPYRAGAGVTEVRINGRLGYRFAGAWSLTLVGGVGRLLGDAADSPIVDDVGDPVQYFGGLVLGYGFGMSP